MKKSTQQAIGIILIVKLFIVSVFAFLTYKNSIRTRTSNDLVIHTNKVLYQSERVISILKDVETGTRGFIITGNEDYLKPFYQSKDSISTSIVALKELTKDNPIQQSRMDSMLTLSHKRLEICSSMQSIRRAPGFTIDKVIGLIEQGKVVMDQLRMIDGEIQQEEKRLLVIREAENTVNIKRSEQDFFIFLISIFVLMGTAAFAARYLTRMRKKETRALSQMDSRLFFFSKRLDEVVKGIADPFFALDKDFNFIFYNEAVSNGMGMGKKKFDGKNFFEVFPQYDKNMLGDKIREVMKNDKPVSFENHEQFLDQWQDVTIYPTSEGVSVYIKDATKRKTYENELHTTQQFLEETNEVAMVGGWEMDVKRSKINWTSVTSQIHEVPETFVPDLKTALLFYKEGESREKITALVYEAMENGKEWDTELQIVTAKGNERWVRTKGKAECENGDCTRLFGIFQDITDKKISEEKLADEERLLKTIIDNVPINIYVKNKNSEKILVNKSELEFSGVDDERDIIGKNDFELYPHESAVIGVEEDRQVMETRQSIIDRETKLVKNDGTENWFLTSKIPFINDHNEVAGLIGISYDITSRKKKNGAV